MPKGAPSRSIVAGTIEAVSSYAPRSEATTNGPWVQGTGGGGEGEGGGEGVGDASGDGGGGDGGKGGGGGGGGDGDDDGGPRRFTAASPIALPTLKYAGAFQS